ncbi:unnamed protein product [Allacma fusca]|uniref:Uncharacterized protein n=1 Tax=Allacma fusca TaxID=39272 RepID=A0A8J2PLT3_9HEXA|nr:unnamed protein product [Allacma fusca]
MLVTRLQRVATVPAKITKSPSDQASINIINCWNVNRNSSAIIVAFNKSIQNCVDRKVLKRDSTGSTSSLRKHVARSHKSVALKGDQEANTSQPSIDNFLVMDSRDKFDQHRFEKLLVEFVIDSNQPFSIVNSSAFCKFSEYWRAEARLPKNDKMKSLCMKRFEQERTLVVEKLRNSPGKIAIITYCWTSKNSVSFHGIIACFISSDWNYEEIMLDFDMIVGHHAGKNLASSLCKVLENYSIIDKVISITCDDASNCDAFVKEFETLCKEKASLNILKMMCKKDVVLINSDDSEDEVDDDEINILESDECSTSDSESISEGEHEDMETGETSMSIYYRAFDLILRDCKFLRKLLLSKAEWCLISDMITFLQPFYNVTLQLSKSKSPSMALTAAVYIALYEHLESFKKGKVGAEMLNAAEAACDKLNKYYPDSDGLVYIMGLVCDPRCKLQWYRIVGISKQVISQNKQTALSYWNEYYNVSEDETVVDETTSSSNNLIAAQMSNRKGTRIDEFKSFLTAPVVDALKYDNALHWWKVV